MCYYIHEGKKTICPQKIKKMKGKNGVEEKLLHIRASGTNIGYC